MLESPQRRGKFIKFDWLREKEKLLDEVRTQSPDRAKAFNINLHLGGGKFVFVLGLWDGDKRVT